MTINNYLGNHPEKPKIAIITACGAKKRDKPMPAWQLYKSARIKAVHNRTMGHEMYILSAKYGLISADQIIRPYEEIMDEEKAKKFAVKASDMLSKYDYVVYYRGGARQAYLNCIKKACRILKKPLIVLGYGNMGGINDLPQVIEFAEREEWEKIHKIGHADTHKFSSKFL